MSRHPMVKLKPFAGTVWTDKTLRKLDHLLAGQRRDSTNGPNR